MNDKKKAFLRNGIFLNIIALIAGVIFIFYGNQSDIFLYDIPLFDVESEFTEGERNTFSTDYPKGDYYFTADTGSLKSGIYNITVDYYTPTDYDHDYYTISCEYNGDGEYYPAVYAEPHILSSLNQQLTYRIWVNSGLDNLKLRIDCGTEDGEIFDYGHDSALYVDKIEISRDYRQTLLYKGLRFLPLLILLNGGLLTYWNKRRAGSWLRDNFYVILGLACIFMVSSLSVFGKFSVGHHDLRFHYARIVGLAEGMESGFFPVKIQPGWLWGHGYAASVCYGDILLYIPAVLYMMGVPIIHAYKAYVLMCNLGTLLIAYFCYQKICGNKYVGVACTALYCLSVTRLLNIYLRAAAGEYSAFMFLPLVLFGIRQIYMEESKLFRKGGLFLCLGMTGIIQSHIISMEMSCIFIGLTVLLMIHRMSKQILVVLSESVLAVFCLNLGFMLPLLDYSTDKLQVFLERKSYGIQRAGLSLYELFSVSSTASGKSQDAMQGVTGRIPESLGSTMLIVLVLTVIVAVRCQEWGTGIKKEFVLSAVLSGTALWMATYYFPYNRLAVVPGFKNIFASIQFPWRFLSIAVPLLTYMASHVLVKIGQLFGRQKQYEVLIVICLAGALQALYCMDMLNRSEEMREVSYDYSINDSSMVMTGEYVLKGTDIYWIRLEQDVVGKNVQLGTPERNGTRIEVSCQAAENARITFPLFAYKYYQCTDVETKERFPISRGENNRIEVELPDYYQGTLKVCFVEPWYWRAAEIVSLITLVWLIVYIWRGKAKKQNG